MSKSKERVYGEIGYYQLTDWWFNIFDKKERKYITSVYQPLGFGKNSLVHGEIYKSSQSRLSFLSALAAWFNKPRDFKIAKKIIEKAEEYVPEAKNVLDIHFHYQNKLEIYYRNRETGEGALDKAISACEQQISISEQAVDAFKQEYSEEHLPKHKGYEQLAIIREKQGDYKSVIEICQNALGQGWTGNWGKRIEKAKKRLVE